MYESFSHNKHYRKLKFSIVIVLLWGMILLPVSSVVAEEINAGIDTSGLMGQLYGGDPDAPIAPIQIPEVPLDLYGMIWQGIDTSQWMHDLYNPSGPTMEENYNNVLTNVQEQQEINRQAIQGIVPKQEPNIVERLFGTFISSIPGAVLNFFGLKDLYELIYGFSGFSEKGTDEHPVPTPTMVWRVFSTADFNYIIMPFNTGLKNVAWTIALAILYLTCIKMARSNANSQRRASAYTMLEDWIIGTILVGGGMILISTLFTVLNIGLSALAPSKHIDFLGSANISKSPIVSTGDFATKMIVAPFYVLALAGIEIALNFIYLQRYFVLIVLISSTPIFCALYFNEKARTAFVYYCKELIGNIFMPLFHAFFLLIYSRIADHTQVGVIPQLMFLIMMIPVSNMMRGILGLAGTGKGLGENLMMGVGLGATMGMMRSFGNLGAALFGGGADVGEAATAGAMMGGGGGNRIGALENQSSSSLGQIAGGGYMGQMASRVSTMRRAGNALGQVYGSIGGAVFGAATGGGNMTMMMGAMAGNKVGGGMGSSFGGAAAVAPIAMRSAGNSERSNIFNEALGGSSPLAEGLSNDTKIALGKVNTASLVSQGLRGTPFVGQAMENRANNASAQAASSVMGEISSNTNSPWESGDMMEKVSTGAGSAIYQRKFEGSGADGQPNYGERKLMDFGQQGHPAGSDSIPMVEQTLYNGDNTRTYKPNDVYTNVGRNDPRGPRGSAILNDLARRR